MFTTFISFLVVAAIFGIISIFTDGFWIYYVPASLIFQSVWLKIIQSAWAENEVNFITKFARMEPSAAAGWVSIISVIYGIFCGFKDEWILLAVCVLIFIFSLTMRFQNR